MANVALNKQQFYQEIIMWKRMLEYLVQENVALKTRLADVLKDGTVTKQIIEMAEHYLNVFTSQDEVISLARRDVADLEKLIRREGLENHLNAQKNIRRYKQLHKELEKLERQFCRLKFEFNEYLAEMPSPHS